MGSTAQQQMVKMPSLKTAAASAARFTALAVMVSWVILIPSDLLKFHVPPMFNSSAILSLVWGKMATNAFLTAVREQVVTNFPFSLAQLTGSGLFRMIWPILPAMVNLAIFWLASCVLAYLRLALFPRAPSNPPATIRAALHDSFTPTILIFLGMFILDYLLDYVFSPTWLYNLGYPFPLLCKPISHITAAFNGNLDPQYFHSKERWPLLWVVLHIVIVWAYIPFGIYVWRRWSILANRIAARLPIPWRRKQAGAGVDGGTLEVPGSILALSGATALKEVPPLAHADRVVGQDEVIKRIDRRLRASTMGIDHRPNRPRAVFLLLGPTGVGKTETAKWIAQSMFGSTKSMVRVNMQEHESATSASSLLGAPRGYVDSWQGGQVTQDLKRNPRSVLLLDEIEKGHPKLLELFMTAFDEGSLGDRSFGESISLTETVVVMTSNLLADRWQELLAMGDEELRNHLVVHGGLKSEILGRVDEVLVFSALDQKALAEIVKRRLDGLKASLYGRGLDLDYDQLLLTRILELTGKGGYGVRQVDQVISGKVAGPIMDALQGPNGGKSTPASQQSRRRAYIYPAADGSIAVTLNQEVWDKAPRWQTVTDAQAMASRRNLLRERVVGQDQALDLIEKHVLAAAKGLRVRLNRPIFSVLLMGPTGVGKTQTAKAMAEMIYGSLDAMVRLDMAEFNGPMAANRLYGSPTGMAGGGAGGELTQPVRSNGRRLVLMDEVEKADPAIWDPMMTVFDEGFLAEAGTGRAVSFRDTVIVMTSNLLAAQAEQLANLGSEDLRDVLVSTGQFRKEFLGRLDRIVVFKRLDLKALETISSRRLEAMMANTRHELGLEVHWTPGVVSLLALQAGQARYGVRRIDEVIGDSVILPLSAFVDGLGGEDRARGADAFLRLDREGSIIVDNHEAPDESEPVAGTAADDWSGSEAPGIISPFGRNRPFGRAGAGSFAADFDVAPAPPAQGDPGFTNLGESLGFESDKTGGPVAVDGKTWKRAKDQVASGGSYGEQEREKLRPKQPRG